MIQHRKPLARSTVPLRRTPIRRVSKKRRMDVVAYSRKRAQFLALHPECQVPECSQPSNEVHHMKGRGRFYLAVSTWMACCPYHHRMIHQHPSWARAEGFMQ